MSLQYLLREKKFPTTKDNYIGVEIEFVMSYDNREKFMKSLVNADLQHNVHLGTDGSVRDTEFVPSTRTDAYGTPTNYRQERLGLELRILATEKEAPHVIKSVCELLKKHHGAINETCGLHVHVDMRNRDKDLVFNNFYKLQDLLFSTQPKKRRESRFCKKLKGLKQPSTDRYYGINGTAMDRLRTIEIRVAEASIDAKEICMWAYLLINIANMKDKLHRKISALDKLTLPEPVKEYFDARIKKFA